MNHDKRALVSVTPDVQIQMMELELEKCALVQLVLTNGFHHACLSCVGLHWNDILETVQRDDALLGAPHLKNVLHFGAQFLREQRDMFYIQILHLFHLNLVNSVSSV